MKIPSTLPINLTPLAEREVAKKKISLSKAVVAERLAVELEASQLLLKSAPNDARGGFENVIRHTKERVANLPAAELSVFYGTAQAMGTELEALAKAAPQVSLEKRVAQLATALKDNLVLPPNSYVTNVLAEMSDGTVTKANLVDLKAILSKVLEDGLRQHSHGGGGHLKLRSGIAPVPEADAGAVLQAIQTDYPKAQTGAFLDANHVLFQLTQLLKFGEVRLEEQGAAMTGVERIKDLHTESETREAQKEAAQAAAGPMLTNNGNTNPIRQQIPDGIADVLFGPKKF